MNIKYHALCSFAHETIMFHEVVIKGIFHYFIYMKLIYKTLKLWDIMMYFYDCLQNSQKLNPMIKSVMQ